METDTTHVGNRRLIDLAICNRAITPQQAAVMLQEITMFPKSTASELLLRHQFVTREELAKLESEMADILATNKHNEDSPESDEDHVLPRHADGAPIRDPAATHPVNQVSLRALPGERALNSYLGFARASGCSDLHLCVGVPPFVRLHGRIHYLDDRPLTSDRSEALNFSCLTGDQKTELLHRRQLDFALEIPNLGRHRCNIYRQRLGWEGAYRVVPSQVPTLDELGMPPILKKLTEYHHGMILVTGPTGSGKNTTVAALLEHINRTRADHIITVEDPIEYVLHRKQCRITQREVGTHTRSFHTALRVALRHDPDVIFVGELRDPETTSIAITAAETGHLVFGTLHTSSAMRTVACMMNFYPPSQRQEICATLADTMRGVISQQLIPRRDGQGLAMALEVLVFTPAVAQMIKDGKTHQLISHMQSQGGAGMQTMDAALMSLFCRGTISGTEAYLRAEFKDVFEATKG